LPRTKTWTWWRFRPLPRRPYVASSTTQNSNTSRRKKTRELKAKQTKVVIKEIRFGPNTDDHDFEFKVKHAKEFLKEGAKIKSYVHFVGRSIVFKERGEILLLKFAQALEDLAKVEQLPKLEGKRMFLYLAPKAAVVAKPAPKPAVAADKDKAPKEAKPAPVKEKEEAPAAETE